MIKLRKLMRIQKFAMDSGNWIDSPFLLESVTVLLHTFTMSALDGSEWSVLRLCE